MCTQCTMFNMRQTSRVHALLSPRSWFNGLRDGVLGKVFWGHRKMYRKELGIHQDHTHVLCADLAESRNCVILDSVLSCLTSSPSINHISSAFRVNLELGRPSLLSLMETIIIRHLVMGLAPQLGFLLLLQTPATYTPRDYQSTKVRVKQPILSTLQ